MAEVKTGIEGELYLFTGTISWSATATAAGSRCGFVEGASWSWEENNVAVWDRGTFSHAKKGRGNGELTIPQAYVDNLAMITYLDSGTVAGSSAPRLQGEIRTMGTGGAVETTVQFSDIQLKSFEANESDEDDKNSFNMSFEYWKQPARGTSSRIS